MANQKLKPTIKLPDGNFVPCQEPVIVSASRSTDIPAFYCDWFFKRLEEGYSVWTNPFNGVKMYISYAKTRFIVFWSKNPRPLLDHLDYLKEHKIGCYVQYTLNDYENDCLEKNVPPLTERIDTFKRLVDKLGKGGVVWRFDPLILTEHINIDMLLGKIENIGDQLKGYTDKLVFSFADIALYKKVERNLKKSSIPYHEWTEDLMKEFAMRLVDLNSRKGWGYKLATCGEPGRYPGIEPNHCVDDELIIKRAYSDIALMKFLKVEFHSIPTEDLFGNCEKLPDNAIDLGKGQFATRGDNRDKGQRIACGCMKSKDVGQYNTCIHGCEYCYANTSKEIALRNYKCHLENPYSESITGGLTL